MPRLHDWQTRMDVWMRNHAQDPFVWGSWDCGMMAASHIDNLTGTTLVETHAEKYSDEASASSYLSGLGLTDVHDIMRATLGDPIENVRLAQRGDIVGFDTLEGPALGIIDMSGIKIIALSPTSVGFIRLRLPVATLAWRV